MPINFKTGNLKEQATYLKRMVWW